jgi:glutaredoxin-like protein
MFEPYGLDMSTVEDKFRSLKDDVTLLFFTRETNCAHCNLAGNLYRRIASVTQKITFESYNFAINREKDRKYGIFAVPALAVIGPRDYGIRYYGHPRGAELNNFLDDIVYISRGENTLSPVVAEKLQELDKKVGLKIFISPDCPYSLPIAKMGLRLAVASDYVSVDIIDAIGFLEISEKYGVRGIPMTVVNEEKSFYGALDEDRYVNNILKFF